MKNEFVVPEPSFLRELEQCKIEKEVKRYKITVAASMGL